MPDEEAILEVAALIVDGVSVSEALLAGDILEARFRAQMVAAHALGHCMNGVQAAAVKVIRLLHGESGPQAETTAAINGAVEAQLEKSPFATTARFRSVLGSHDSSTAWLGHASPSRPNLCHSPPRFSSRTRLNLLPRQSCSHLQGGTDG
ncbi:hypothetical protein ACVWWJ_002629 [Luteibacter sp. HA06]